MSYYFAFVLATLVSALSLNRNLRLVQFIPFVAILLAIFVGIRFNSVDYFAYENIFSYVNFFHDLSLPNYIPSGGEKPVEAFFSLIILLVKYLGGTYKIFIFFLALISIGIKIYLFQKMSNFFYLSLLLYVSMYLGKDLGQIRNGLASALVLLTVLFIYNRCYIKSFLSMTLAVLTHLASVIALPLYYARKFSNPILMGVFLVISYLGALYGGIGLLVVDELAKFFGLGEEYRIIRYIDTRFAESYSAVGGTILMHVGTALAFVIYMNRLTFINKYNVILIPMYVYGVVIINLFVDYGILVARIKDTLCLPASMIVLPSTILLFDDKSRPIAYFIFLAYASLMFFTNLPQAPYDTILFK